MNKAIIFYTFLRVFRPGTLMTLIAFVLVYPTAVATFMSQSSKVSFDFESLMNLFVGPLMINLIAFTFVSSSIANAKSLDDGEYLVVLFSRPIFRWTYVISKWMAGAILVILITGLQTLIFISLCYLTGRANQISFGFIDIANLVLNSLQAAALIVMLFSFPARIGIMGFVVLLYFAFILPLMCNSIPEISLWLNGDFRNLVHVSSNSLREFIYSPIDLEPYFNSVQILWLPIITYLSNVALYLWVAIVVMNRREFFYTN